MADEIEESAPAEDDIGVVRRILAGELDLFEVVMRRHNQQLYRAARAILSDEAEVEDVLQQAYLNAFRHLRQFEARSQLATWLTRIVINEARLRRRRSLRRPRPVAHDLNRARPLTETVATAGPSPEHQAYAGELQRVLERAIDSLPEAHRVVFVLRDVEGMSTIETGSALGLGAEAVKTRLHRARAALRRAIAARAGDTVSQSFQFHAPRCDRVVGAVMRRLRQDSR